MITEEKVQKISPQQAADGGMFGPVYHGTTAHNWEKIEREGFKIFIGHERSGDISHGYEMSDYSGGIPAPIHHLGFGIYFTTVKNIAKRFNGGTVKGLKTYYLDVPRIEEINWGSPNTMMKWWLKSGYDYRKTPETSFGNPRTNLKLIQQERLRATNSLTDELKSKYDAVWYKGKSIRQLLDGDQICVFDPSNIYEVDKKLAKAFEVGSIVVSKGYELKNIHGDVYRSRPAGLKGLILKRTPIEDFLTKYPGAQWVNDANKYFFVIKWEKGGTEHQVLDTWVEPSEIYRKL